jgi:hypothetical protein
MMKHKLAKRTGAGWNLDGNCDAFFFNEYLMAPAACLERALGDRLRRNLEA